MTILSSTMYEVVKVKSINIFWGYGEIGIITDLHSVVRESYSRISTFLGSNAKKSTQKQLLFIYKM